MEQQSQRLHLVLRAITALSTVALVLSIVISYYGIRKEHEWNRRRHTLEIIAGFEDHVAKYRDTLTNYFPGLYLKDKRGQMEPELGRMIWKLEATADSDYDVLTDSEKLKDVRHELIGLFNYMEYLAQAHHQDVVDHAAFEESLADTIILYHDYFKEFIKSSQSELGYSNWKPVTDFVVAVKRKRGESTE